MVDKFNYSQDKPEAVYSQAQLNMLNDLEGVHDKKPDKEALLISVSLSVIEAGVAFSMIASAGTFIASIVALFPVALLWAIANYHADNVELPEAYDQLVEKYHEKLQ
ncbi:hypothetical protein G7B40_010235 [Aetokthonos hydrillicola Thurmond2011]|jgi:hypothetical protein|uniref:Uncharacterized protein n=1 Tax=Aetokthonos hydrillicola Thurmond2011 TaxID=2712845 RepID=A0AAP5I823_9CYAN|nr:hypothetical protein [Aetokthonos hydrillicola]MBO3458993.1 hypothetical protein [Aetokthonos hydrillicola CCALA 1050]MBW4589101.1 hypothetical protein [Aetokthonos hydrillicola CCALA 1050]MDR9894943.1 hypothetical protein [Aetokthonos hydrillicola Thurmond2011]